MSVEWFCRISGEVSGPFSAHQLKELAQSGRLTPEDQVRQGADAVWITAERVKGLFPSTPAVRSEPDLPVAQPLEPAAKKPATIRTAEPLDAPPARPAAQPSRASALPSAKTAAPNPFEIHADAERPVSRSTSRPTATARRKKSRLSTFLIGGSIVVFAICLIVVVVMVDPSMNRSDEGPKPTSATAKRSAEDDLDAAIEGPVTKPSEPPAESPPAESPSDEPSAEPEEEEIKWHSAAQPIQVDNVSVEILSATIGPVPVIEESGAISPYGNGFLLLTIGLRNVDEKDELKYTSWGIKDGPASKGLALSDTQGKRYARFRPSKLRIEGELEQETIAPSDSIEDVLAFQAPKDPTEALHLQLPCAAFGGEGSLYLEIPAEMLVLNATAGDNDGAVALPELGLGVSDANEQFDDGVSRINSATPVSDPYGDEEDPDGDVSKIFRDIEESGGGEKETAE